MKEIAINDTYTIRCVESEGVAYEDCEKVVFITSMVVITLAVYYAIFVAHLWITTL